MKKISLIILTAYMSFLLACFKDKGNYDYKNINEIKINGLATNYPVVLGVGVLHIEPAIQMSETDADPARFNYYWILYRESTVIDTLGREAVLNAKINVT